MPPQKWSKYSKRSVRVDETGTRTQFYTHRIAWVLEFGSIDPDKVIRHQCDSPPCINPSHLELGSKDGNWFDRKFLDIVKAWFVERPMPKMRLPHISLWSGWELPGYEEAYERQEGFARAAVTQEARRK